MTLGLAEALYFVPACDGCEPIAYEVTMYGAEVRSAGLRLGYDREFAVLVSWWNLELLDRTPEWVAERTGIDAGTIREIAIGFAMAAPASISWLGGGPAMSVRGAYAAMAIHALNGLVGSVDSPGGAIRGASIPQAPLPPEADFIDAPSAEGNKQPKIDQRGTLEFPALNGGRSGGGVVTNRVADAVLAEDPYDLKVVFAYWCNFNFSCPQNSRWDEALARIPFLVHSIGDEGDYPLVWVDHKSRLNREGRSANCTWHQDLKDVDPGDAKCNDVAKLNPADAARFGIRDGARIRVVSPTGSIECRAKLWEGTQPGTICKTYGQGHWAFGRVAALDFHRGTPRGGNNNAILPADYERMSGSSAYYAVTRVYVETV